MPEHLVGVVLGAGTRLALQLAGVGQDGVGLLLGDAHDLLLAGDRDGLATGILDHTIGLHLGIVQKALALAHNLASLRELGGEQVANLVHDVERSGDVHLAQVALAEDGLRVLEKNRELLEQPQHSGFVHCCSFLTIAPRRPGPSGRGSQHAIHP